MTQLRKGRRVLSVLLALLMVAALFAMPVYAETASEKYERLKGELAATRAKIEEYKDDLAAAKQLKAALEQEKAIIDEMVEVNKQEITRVEGELAAKEEAIAQKRQSIYENDQLLQQRLIAIYKMNNATALSQLLNVDTFSDFFTMLDAMRRISKHDTDLLGSLSDERTQLEAEQAEIDALLADLTAYYEELLQNQADLASNIAAADASISQTQAQIAAQQAIEGEQYEELKKAQQEMAAIAGSMGGSSKNDGSEYVGGVFTWPVPGYYDISCYFGAPDPNGAGHRGMDVRAPAGTSIVACGNGTVITAAYAHSSYGNYIIIDHGNGVKTLYAHCTALLASVGAQVSTGQTIATVGSTGFSTGNHLHLEVHDGGLQNPLNYLKG